MNLKIIEQEKLDIIIKLRLELWKELGKISDLKEYDFLYNKNIEYFEKKFKENSIRISTLQNKHDEIISIGIGIIIDKPPVNYEDLGREGYIFNMNTKSNLRNKGYGTIILNDLIDFFKTQNIKRVTLNANEKSFNFYKKNQFNGNHLNMSRIL
jgi:ribosomal protein S18 acetylase RimI-like enzyme